MMEGGAVKEQLNWLLQRRKTGCVSLHVHHHACIFSHILEVLCVSHDGFCTLCVGVFGLCVCVLVLQTTAMCVSLSLSVKEQWVLCRGSGRLGE